MQRVTPLHRRVALAVVVSLVVIPFYLRAEGAGAILGRQTLRQPSYIQIAGAIDRAAGNTLPAGYPALDGAPSIPPVLLKAIAWLESGWRQFRAPDRPLVSADGGYGVMQVTSGLGGVTLSPTLQSAIANNYVYNIACGARILAEKWAATPHTAASDPGVIEDWYYAIWAYNAWGWRNNPTNPAFTRTGTPHTHPWAYPYQERVFYLVSHPPRGADGQPLWTPVPVTAPDPAAIGRGPRALPEPAIPHSDAPSPDASLALPSADSASPRADLTFPDGAMVRPGARVHKVWLVRNTGGRFWSGYTWAFTSGDRLAAPMTRTVPFVPPLADVQVAVDMVAPAQPGVYTGYWQLFDPAGQPVGGHAWITIEVVPAIGAPISTGRPSAVATTIPIVVRACTGSASPGGLDDATFVADLSIPDGTVVAPGQVFTKTWELQNTGTTTWDGRYHWQFEAGSPLGPTRAIIAPAVQPGGLAQLSVRMVAPRRPGSYCGWWQMTNAAGLVFGTQAWVSVRVEPGVAATTTPAAVTPMAATPTAPAPISTVKAVVSAPHPAQAPWFGPAADRAFFAEGYTGGAYQEYLSLLNPRASALHAQIAVYRADGAVRIIFMDVAASSRRTLNLNVLAPRMSTAVRVVADGPAVVERALYLAGANGHVVAGAPLPSRRWYVAEGYISSRFSDGLRLFNPYDVVAAVTITAYGSNGVSRTSYRTVAGNARLSVSLADIAPHGGAAFTVDSGVPIVVESVVRSKTASGPAGAMALAAPSLQWYFPDGGTGDGNEEYVTVLNPNPVAASVTLQPVTADGYRPRAKVRVGPHTRIIFAVHDRLRQAGLAAIVVADHPVVAQEARYTRAGGSALVDGAPAPARSWGLAEGYTGHGFKEWITLFNPSARMATVTVHIFGPKGYFYVAIRNEPPHHRDYLFVNGLVPIGRVAAVVDADRPIVAGRTLIFNGDKGLSTTIGVPLG